MITQLELKEYYLFNSDTGEFTRKKHRVTKYVGEIAGKIHNGYVRISHKNKFYSAHRLAWLYVYGFMPKMIDHINGNRSDNRICNLREANHSTNAMNRKISTNNKCGVKGVRWAASNKKWRAQIVVSGKHIHLGMFLNINDAENAVVSARNQLHGEFANHGEFIDTVT